MLKLIWLIFPNPSSWAHGGDVQEEDIQGGDDRINDHDGDSDNNDDGDEQP